MIIRETYLDWLRRLQDKKLIKVITGVRRCGKSTLLELFRQDLNKRGIKKSQIQTYNFEEQQPEELYNQRKLHDYIMSKINPETMNYIFLDEIQKVEHFEECVASLAAKENIDIYMTGSNAFLLSGELATYLTGRYITIHMLPLSFAEYRQLFPEEQNVDRLFMQYMNSTAFPEAAAMLKDDPAAPLAYLEDLYRTIVEKDITTRYEIRNHNIFQKVVSFVCDSVGSSISASAISRHLETQHIVASSKAISNYLDYLSTCYLIYPVNRCDLKGGSILSTNGKYYVVDLGLRQMLLGQLPESDLGHKLENIVFLELLRRKEGKIFIGKYTEKEVDFVVQKYGGERDYYQVAYHVDGRPETLERELEPLRRIRDNHPKTLLTMDYGHENFAGIRKLNVVDWLLGKRIAELNPSVIRP